MRTNEKGIDIKENEAKVKKESESHHQVFDSKVFYQL